LALRPALIAAAMVVATATAAAGQGATSGLLAGFLGGAMAAIAVYGNVNARLLGPLRRALPGDDPLAALARVQARAQADAERLAALEAATADLRHDIRGFLSPAMMVADRLVDHADPAVQRAGATVVRAVQRSADRLAETRHTG